MTNVAHGEAFDQLIKPKIPKYYMLKYYFCCIVFSVGAYLTVNTSKNGCKESTTV